MINAKYLNLSRDEAAHLARELIREHDLVGVVLTDGDVVDSVRARNEYWSGYSHGMSAFENSIIEQSLAMTRDNLSSKQNMVDKAEEVLKSGVDFAGHLASAFFYNWIHKTDLLEVVMFDDCGEEIITTGWSDSSGASVVNWAVDSVGRTRGQALAAIDGCEKVNAELLSIGGSRERVASVTLRYHPTFGKKDVREFHYDASTATHLPTVNLPDFETIAA